MHVRRHRHRDAQPSGGAKRAQRGRDPGARAPRWPSSMRTPGARVVVLRGAGDRAFCAGADLKGMFRAGPSSTRASSTRASRRVLEAIPRMRAPVIARVQGYALAGGCGLAAACDLVIAADDAVFGLPEIKLGLLPLMVLAPILRMASPRRVLELVLTGRELPAREALEIGLVTRVVPQADLDRAVGRGRADPRGALADHAGAGQGGLLPRPRSAPRAGARAPAGPPHHRRAVRGRPGRHRGVPGEARPSVAEPVVRPCGAALGCRTTNPVSGGRRREGPS